jgi:hypothetical protein
MNKVWIGWDNGIGNISAIWPDKPAEYKITPIKKCLNYTKKFLIFLGWTGKNQRHSIGVG